jgi:TolA-binding protein
MANAELRTANEQLLINAEEAASSHEEVETLNEEMQATNEELETLNEELQATVEELNTTNDELQSRSADLESANAAREYRLASLMQERDALAQALALRGDLVAVFAPDDTPVYLSPGLDGDSLVKSIAKLKGNGSIKLGDGRACTVTPQSVDLNGKSLRVFLLRPEAAKT